MLEAELTPGHACPWGGGGEVGPGLASCRREAAAFPRVLEAKRQARPPSLLGTPAVKTPGVFSSRPDPGLHRLPLLRAEGEPCSSGPPQSSCEGQDKEDSPGRYQRPLPTASGSNCSTWDFLPVAKATQGGQSRRVHRGAPGS